MEVSNTKYYNSLHPQKILRTDEGNDQTGFPKVIPGLIGKSGNADYNIPGQTVKF